MQNSSSELSAEEISNLMILSHFQLNIISQTEEEADRN